MSRRTVYLSAIPRTVTLGQYVRGVRLAIVNPDAEFRHGLDSWWPTSGREIRRQFRRAMHDRINARVPYAWRREGVAHPWKAQ